MAKKQFGKIAALAALAGAAVGITYFLRYKSFHEELEEDFHDFEDDLDEFDVKEEQEESPQRNYVSLTPGKEAGNAQNPEAQADSGSSVDLSGSSEENGVCKSEGQPKASSENADDQDSDVEFLDDEPVLSESAAGASSAKTETASTTIVEDEETEKQ